MAGDQFATVNSIESTHTCCQDHVCIHDVVCAEVDDPGGHTHENPAQAHVQAWSGAS